MLSPARAPPPPRLETAPLSYYDHPEPFAWLRTKALLDAAIVVAIMAPLIRDCATEGRILDLALDAGAVFVALYLIRAFYDEAYGREFDAYDRARDLALRRQAQAERLAIEYDDLDYDEDEEGYDDHDYESYRVAQPEPRRGWRWRPTKMAIEMVSEPDDEE